MGETSKHANHNVSIDMVRIRYGVYIYGYLWVYNLTNNDLNDLICCERGSSEYRTKCFCGRWSGPDSDVGSPKKSQVQSNKSTAQRGQ